MSERTTPRRFHEADWRVVRDDARVAAAIAAGGHMVSDEDAPGWWTLADAEGNEVDVASWPDRV